MEASRILAYKFPDDDTSDDSSSSSSSDSSNSSTVSKKPIVPMSAVKTEKLSPQDHLASVIERLNREVKLTRKNSQGDEFSSRSRSSSDSKESEEEGEEKNIKEKEESTQTEYNDDTNDSEDEDIESDGSTLLQYCQLGPNATPKEVSLWLKYNNFKDLVNLFKGFNYYDLRRLDRNDFIEMCGTVKGIQIYNAVQSKPVRPLRTVYCALEPPNNNGMNWQPVYLHSLSALDFNAEIVSRFNLSTRKHSLWMEGPYGIHILVDNEVVEYMEDNDMFLIRLVEYPAVEHYKIILKKYL